MRKANENSAISVMAAAYRRRGMKLRRRIAGGLGEWLGESGAASIERGGRRLENKRKRRRHQIAARKRMAWKRLKPSEE